MVFATFLALFVFCFCPDACRVNAQDYRIAFYNTENLHDTIPNPLISDADFTPSGVKQWNADKYNTKIKNIARVIDDLNASVIGLCEVENEQVVKDLLTAMRSDYNYIHRNTSDFRGMDQVLLYRGDRFFPSDVKQVEAVGLKREFLVVTGTFATGSPTAGSSATDSPTGAVSESITLIVCHMPSMLNDDKFRVAAARSLRALVDSILKSDMRANIVVMGDFNAPPSTAVARIVKTGLHSPFYDLARQGYGSYVYRDKRQMFDYMLISPALSDGHELTLTSPSGIFVRDYMIDNSQARKGYPLRSFDGREYIAGFSDHLPVFITITNQSDSSKNTPK